VILASALLEKNKKALGKDYSVVETFPGSTLVGQSYEPLWDFSANVPNPHQLNMHVVVADEYVTTDDGTGVVHLALYGEDDFRLIKKYGLVQNQHVLADGHCGPNCGHFQGRFFREEGFDVDIVKDLAARGLLFDKYRHEHSYPHCWRCKTGLMYFAKSSWFLKTTALKEVMLAENAKINWQPPHIRDGRFGNWLENNVDWAISRERYWGSPINIWTSTTNPEKQLCPASVSELRGLGAYFRSTGKLVEEGIDLHISTVDDIEIKRDGEIYRREVGVLDCWFNAGIMPWGQFGYPAKPGSKELFESQFPADFICEAIDQTRGWFYTLIAASCLVAEKASFKNVICTEHVLDVNGKKMSKSLGNVIAPLPLIDQFGADAVRWTFYDSNPWLPKRYSDELPREALRTIFIPLWNCYSFFVTYANLDKWTPGTGKDSGRSELDRWILSALRTTLVEVTAGLENYDIARAALSIRDFIDVLSNWYIRRSRKRFWRSENDSDKESAYATLYEVLVTLSKVIAPLSPFIAETMYQNLVRSFDEAAPESVHLTEWPDPAVWREELALEEEVAAIQEGAALARALRTEHNLKVRQPLSELILTPSNGALGSRLVRHIDSLAEEVNVKEVVLVANAGDFVDFTVKPNWKVLGPRFGDRMKDLNAAIQTLGPAEIGTFLGSKKLALSIGGAAVELVEGDLAVEHKAKPGLVARSGRRVTVALKTELTPALIAEGNAREIISVVQKHRKKLNLEISDHIALTVWGNESIKAAVELHGGTVSKECLAKTLSFGGGAPPSSEVVEEFDVNGHAMHLKLVKS
jgi:isoleucyl-tRNA synthetase